MIIRRIMKPTSIVLLITILVTSSGCATFGGKLNNAELEQVRTQTKSVAVITTHNDAGSNYILFIPRPTPLFKAKDVLPWSVPHQHSKWEDGFTGAIIRVIIAIPVFLYIVFVYIPVGTASFIIEETYPRYENVVKDGYDPAPGRTVIRDHNPIDKRPEILRDRDPLNVLPKEKTLARTANLDRVIRDRRIPLLDNEADLVISRITATHLALVALAEQRVLSVSELREDKQSIDLRTLRKDNVDLVIEIKIKRRGFVGLPDPNYREELVDGWNSEVFYVLAADVRARRTSDGAEVHKASFIYTSPDSYIDQWVAHEPYLQDFVQAVEETFGAFMKQFAEEVFLVYGLPDNNLGEDGSYCGLKAYLPALSDMYSERQTGSEYRKAVTSADSIQPLFVWEAFPRAKDRRLMPQPVLDSISDVTYDLLVYDKNELLYTKSGLETADIMKNVVVRKAIFSVGEEIPEIRRVEKVAEHKITMPLKQGKKYTWSVRARFKLNGQSRVTSWSSYKGETQDGCRADATLPDSTLMYRFATLAADQNQVELAK